MNNDINAFCEAVACGRILEGWSDLTRSVFIGNILL